MSQLCAPHRKAKRRLANLPRGSATKRKQGRGEKKADLPNNHTYPTGFLQPPQLELELKQTHMTQKPRVDSRNRQAQRKGNKAFR